MDLIEFEGEQYPAFQATGNAARFTLPFAKEFCHGEGYDIGCGKKEWALPGAIPVDLTIDDGYDATHLPDTKVDYIFSSHCLEHLDDWVRVIEYWSAKIKDGGILYLYLPDYSQEYWRPWNNTKHKNIMDADQIADLLMHLGYERVVYQSCDMNNSFTVVGEK